MRYSSSRTSIRFQRTGRYHSGFGLSPRPRSVGSNGPYGVSTEGNSVTVPRYVVFT
ncbi:hypothetical protein BN903_61 [Halorubrum sp. AJ67]|nr:hypothetical protein BN903_61 [Halorubrum sp. AJ67]